MRYPAGLVTILVLAIAAICALSPPAWAESSPAATPSPTDTASPTPPLAVTPSPINLVIHPLHVWDALSTTEQAVGYVLLTNTNPELAERVDVSGYSSEGTLPINWGTDVDASADKTIDVGANRASQEQMSFMWDKTGPAAGWVVLSPSSGPPVTVPFQVLDAISGWALMEILGGAATLALLIMVFVWLWLAVQISDKRNLREEIKPTATWTFQDSWATNVTALGAILGTVLGLSGFLSEVLPGRSTGVFVGFSVLYGLIVAASALVFQAMYWKGKPTYGGLLVAGGMVVAAVIGELATALLLVTRGQAAVGTALAALAAVCVVLFFYSKASVRSLLKPETTATNPPAALL